MRNAITLPFDEALAAERQLFLKLVSGDQSSAQRHLFFAEREAAKVPGKDLQRRRIERVGIIGGGTMSGGIAMAFANGGLPGDIARDQRGGACGAGWRRSRRTMPSPSAAAR
ncbi:hypothetical protein ACVOMV_04930 [Mesorhizobium atlanticum]